MRALDRALVETVWLTTRVTYPRSSQRASTRPIAVLVDLGGASDQSTQTGGSCSGRPDATDAQRKSDARRN